ncbi:unnamed protein product [Soboliphyme baturini]|uniref:Inner membrane protein n=1 Tax=Soboliphyme baturini TaxID=241478 RepID=A0A183IS62_9BILA|nr:unnamed protein product [Soboliphyme baturini]
MGNCASAKGGRSPFSRHSSVLPNHEQLIRAFSQLIVKKYAWVLFSHGTAVVIEEYCDQPERLKHTAVQTLRDNCCDQPGTPLSDFNATYLPNLSGWLITYHSNHIRTFIPDEDSYTDSQENNAMTFGLLGRMLRNRDCEDANVIYIHLPRPKSCHSYLPTYSSKG